MKNSKLFEYCVFYYFDEYELKVKKQKIHKIININFFIKNELKNQEKLRKINNITSRFYLCQNTSELKITQIDGNDIKINNINTKHDDTILLEYEKRELTNFKTYLKNSASPKKYILNIINSYKYLLNSLNLLVSNNICHNHINFDSILVDNSDYQVISNFSFSIDYSHKDIEHYIKHFIITYDPSYIEWPIELHILSYLLTNNLNSLSSYNIESIIHDFTINNNILSAFGSSFVSSYKEEAEKYFKKYINQNYEYILTDIIQHAHTWDNYALSILFLRILIGTHRSIGIKNKFIILFMKLLVCNINLNPLKRVSIDMTINNFNNLLDILEPTDYKEIINSLMSA